MPQEATRRWACPHPWNLGTRDLPRPRGLDRHARVGDLGSGRSVAAQGAPQTGLSRTALLGCGQEMRQERDTGFGEGGGDPEHLWKLEEVKRWILRGLSRKDCHPAHIVISV